MKINKKIVCIGVVALAIIIIGIAFISSGSGSSKSGKRTHRKASTSLVSNKANSQSKDNSAMNSGQSNNQGNNQNSNSNHNQSNQASAKYLYYKPGKIAKHLQGYYIWSYNLGIQNDMLMHLSGSTINIQVGYHAVNPKNMKVSPNKKRQFTAKSNAIIKKYRASNISEKATFNVTKCAKRGSSYILYGNITSDKGIKITNSHKLVFKPVRNTNMLEVNPSSTTSHFMSLKKDGASVKQISDMYYHRFTLPYERSIFKLDHIPFNNF